MRDQQEEYGVTQAGKDFLKMVTENPVLKALGRAALVSMNYSSTINDFVNQRKTSSEKWRFSKQVPMFAPTALAEARAKHIRDTDYDYEKNLNYKEITKSIDASITAYLNSRLQTFDGLLSLTEDEKQKKKLNEIAKGDQEKITQLLKKDPIPAIINIQKDLADLKDNVSLDKLYQLRWDAEEAFKAQQDADIECFNSLFDSSQPLESLSRSQDSMVNTLKGLHEKNNTLFNNRMTDEITLLHNTEENRLNALIILSQNPEMAAKIKEISVKALATNAQGGTLTVEMNDSGIPSKKDDHFKGVTLNQLHQLKTITSRSRSWYDLRWSRRGEVKKENNALSINLPHRIWDSFYYHNLENNLKTDLLELAILLKTAHPDQDSVTLTINHPSDSHARDVAIAAYAAFREMGYKTIDIKIGEQLIKLTGEPDEHGNNSALFPNPMTKQVIDEKAGLYETKRQQESLDRGIKSYQAFKNALPKKEKDETQPELSSGPSVI